IGTLFAFVLVCIGITILRYKDPGRHRPFKVPLGAWFLPILGALSCLFLMYYLPPTSWWRFIAWLMIGMAEGKRTMIAVGSIGIGLACMLIGFVAGMLKGESAKSD